uniref:Uncharacterized protein n=1 Tax=Tetraselmis sp. GSL018 TaxID=582737 RepID=A0A061RLY0_9CHLO
MHPKDYSAFKHFPPLEYLSRIKRQYFYRTRESNYNWSNSSPLPWSKVSCQHMKKGEIQNISY